MAILKQVHFGQSGQEKLISGINTLADAVKSTLGPKGRTVLIESENHTHGVTISKDGVTVARSITLFDPIENMAVNVAREASEKTATLVGDGTTTSLVLTQAIINEASSHLTAGVDTATLTRDIQAISNKVLEYLSATAVPVTNDTLVNVATISANGDAEIGELIAEAYTKVSYVTVADSKTEETYAEIIEGVKVDRPVGSRFFITDQKKGECVLQDPYVLVCDQKIENLSSLEHVLAPIVQNGKSLLIISEMGANALNTLNVNAMKGTIKVCQIMPPDFGYRRKELMEDIAAMVGARLVSEDTGDDLSLVGLDWLGKASKVISGQEQTIIVGGEGEESVVKARIEALEGSNDTFDKQRLANMTGGIGVIYVGADSEIEQKEKKDRVDDAVCAVRAAMDEGVLPGGGVALHNASTALSEGKSVAHLIMSSALKAPMRQILKNAGDDWGYVEGQMDTPGLGFDVRGQKYGDMIEMGVTDPAKVTRIALQNAVSVATTIMGTSVIVSNVRDL
uniref:Chaperonin GroEL n=1 Tax=uncultured virus TaxID=340016 RepID=A0A240F7B9_9VIRU|nr:chaperonin GroEL [uncultured virus]